MKKLLYIVLILSSPILFSSCSDSNDDAEAQKEFLADLSGTWVVEHVEVDDIVVTDAFPDMEITFDTNKNITVVNSVGNIWPASSTFVLEKAGDLYDLLRDDEVTVEIGELTESTLVFYMTFETPPGGRVSSVAGNYTFEMSR